MQIGFYYPLFFFQLDSIKHGISVNFSFYSVGSSTTQVIRLLTKYLAGDSKWVQLYRAIDIGVHRVIHGCYELDHNSVIFVWYGHFWHDWVEHLGQCRCAWCALWLFCRAE
jgi:hypothetical protein